MLYKKLVQIEAGQIKKEPGEKRKVIGRIEGFKGKPEKGAQVICVQSSRDINKFHIEKSKCAGADISREGK